jgi:hypothetical protein
MGWMIIIGRIAEEKTAGKLNTDSLLSVQNAPMRGENLYQW